MTTTYFYTYLKSLLLLCFGILLSDVNQTELKKEFESNIWDLVQTMNAEQKVNNSKGKCKESLNIALCLLQTPKRLVPHTTVDQLHVLKVHRECFPQQQKP